MKIYYSKAVYDNREIQAVIKTLKNSPLKLMDGPQVKLFEKKIAAVFGKKYGLMVNSGSSANLLALASLKLKKNTEVITPLLTFSTTVAPIYQLNLIPKFIDVKKGRFIADTNQIIKAISKKTKVIMLPNLLGDVAEWAEIKKIAKKNSIILIEDSADTIGYSINNKSTGNLSDIVTTSFYASHVITAGGFGGMACFNDEVLYKNALLMRGWGRNSALFGEKEDIKNRFTQKLHGIPYDGKYIFSSMGYNFIPSEISAAFGLVQLEKLKKNINIRKKNFNKIKNFFEKKFSNYFSIPEISKNIKSVWLAFPILIKNKIINRNNLQVFLEKNNIQTRTIFTGNIIRQPMMKEKKYKIIKGAGKESDKIMKNGILIGCHHGLKNQEIKFMLNTFIKYIKKMPIKA
jgi:CDP-6-deoxy-D-xylo-4-hexulose-3-dehydrase